MVGWLRSTLTETKRTLIDRNRLSSGDDLLIEVFRQGCLGFNRADEWAIWTSRLLELRRHERGFEISV